MTDLKISELGAGTAATGTEVGPFVQGSDTVKLTLAQVKTFTSASPTLVTPALGTPASGTLTNATGLPIVAGTTGTLSVARGGTGTTTPGIVAGTNITVTGTWPNQTINSTGGGSPGGSSGQIQYDNAGSFGGANLWWATDQLQQRNGVNAQSFRVYGSYTDASNGWWLEANYSNGTAMYLRTIGNGTGSGNSGDLNVSSTDGVLNLSGGAYVRIGSGSKSWLYDSNGAFYPVTDAACDIGTTSAHIRQMFFAPCATTQAQINLSPGGATPTSPNNGDIWFDGTNLKIRIGGVTKTVTVT